jgi:hypothetical protein
MSDGAFPTFQKISQTPLRDIVRGRLTGRLDWKRHLAAANLPEEAAGLIRRVVQRTRLFRLEKAAVADELIAHFLDGLAAGSTAGQLVEKFGEERIAARLIRRAKRRGRAWPWQVLSIAIRVLAVVLTIYAVLLVRFCLGHPTPTVDYVAKLNEPISQTAESDRAWPLWRQAILGFSDGITLDGSLKFSEAVFTDRDEKPPWSETVQWLDAHVSPIATAREAGRKPALGFILGPHGSEDDPEMHFHPVGQVTGEPLICVFLPHLNYMRAVTMVLTLDARLAAERGDTQRVEADLMSAFGLGRQLDISDGFLITQLVGLSVDGVALDRLRFVLLNYPHLLSDDQLIGFAHALSGPKVAGDLMTLNGERYFFSDIVQRLYTDDGHGDGHMTLAGLRSVPTFVAIVSTQQPGQWAAYSAASTLPGMIASRAEVLAKYDQLMNQTEANFSKPLRQIDLHEIDSQIIAMKNSPVDRIRFMLLADLFPALSHIQQVCERYLGERDGVIVGIALELYHRRHGRHPDSLSDLTPELLPEVPADRITGDPVKYRLIEGKPVVYSVGADRVDDGGVGPATKDLTGRFINYRAGSWGLDPKAVPRGDWLLFAREPADKDSN